MNNHLSADTFSVRQRADSGHKNGGQICKDQQPLLPAFAAAATLNAASGAADVAFLFHKIKVHAAIRAPLASPDFYSLPSGSFCPEY